MTTWNKHTMRWERVPPKGTPKCSVRGCTEARAAGLPPGNTLCRAHYFGDYEAIEVPTWVGTSSLGWNN